MKCMAARRGKHPSELAVADGRYINNTQITKVLTEMEPNETESKCKCNNNQ